MHGQGDVSRPAHPRNGDSHRIKGCRRLTELYEGVRARHAIHLRPVQAAELRGQLLEVLKRQLLQTSGRPIQSLLNQGVKAVQSIVDLNGKHAQQCLAASLSTVVGWLSSRTFAQANTMPRSEDHEED